MSEIEAPAKPAPQNPIKRPVWWDPIKRSFHIEGIGTPPATAILLPEDFDHLALLSRESSDDGVAHDEATGLPTIAPREKVTPTVAQAVAALQRELATHEAAGVEFAPSGSPAALFGTDVASLSRYTLAAAMVQAGTRKDGAAVLAANGAPVMLTNSDVLGLVTKVHAYLAACGEHYLAIYATLGVNPAAALNAGWPSGA